MKFNDYRYLYPPRPDNAIPSHMMTMYEDRGFVAQVKKNGTCNVIAVSPSKTIHAMNRHFESHKLWSPTVVSSAPFQNLPVKGWCVFVAELMHSKVTSGRRDTNYINDVLVYDGDYLVGTTYAERIDMLKDMFSPQITDEDYCEYKIGDNASIAKCFSGKFNELFDSLDNPEDEGLVLKNPKASLAMCSKAASNSGWMVKCRRPHKNFTF